MKKYRAIDGEQVYVKAALKLLRKNPNYGILVTTGQEDMASLSRVRCLVLVEENQDYETLYKEANARANEANARANEANTRANEANTRVNEANARANEANARVNELEIELSKVRETLKYFKELKEETDILSISSDEQ